jgi:hypothetical protein
VGWIRVRLCINLNPDTVQEKSSVRTNYSLLLPAFLAAVVSITAHASSESSAHFFTPPVLIGEHFSNIYSIATSTKADGFDEKVARNSGSSDYTLRQVSAEHALTFDETDAYDGSPVSHGENVIRDQGSRVCWNGACRTYTDASGLVYNRLLWGNPPANLKPGTTWQVAIRQPWELGSAGIQTVTVVTINHLDGTVTLKREGSSEGFAADESAQVTLIRKGQPVTLDVKPGKARWIGYTTFQRGIIISDELLVVRTDVLQSKDVDSMNATRRRYILLNAAPYPTNPQVS